MQKRFIIVMILGVLCWLSPISGFAEPALKIAYVNMNMAINNSQEGQRSKKFLEAQLTRTRQLLRDKEQELIAKEQDLQGNMMLSREARIERQEEINRLRQQLLEERDKAQNSLRQDELRHTNKILKDLVSIVEQIALEQEFDLVLEYNFQQIVLFAKFNMVDITDQVTAAYDRIQGGQ
jgi:Skp family chaperone for outer membrane proteins